MPDRVPIGKKEIIEKAPYDTLRSFYHDWYRPELQAIIAVGDFDVDKIETLIKKQFGAIPASTIKKQRPLYPVPDQKELLVSIATDREATQTEVNLEHKLPLQELKTYGDFRNQLLAPVVYGHA
jgi:zinc protease